MRVDRREIAPMLRPLFPSMPKDASSDDWHGFLNAMTGLDIGPDEDNASAFDKWRIALSEKGYPTWQYTESRVAQIQSRGAELKAAEEKRQAEVADKLQALAKEAPSVAAEELLTPKP